MTLEAGGTADPDRIRIVEVEQYRKDGSIVLVENHLSFMRDEAKKPLGIISVSHDITQRRRAEEDLKRTNIFLDSIIENIPNMIFLKDARNLRFIRLNRAGGDLLGYSRDDLLGKSDYDFFPKEQADHFTKKDREVLNGKEVVDIPEESLQTRTKGERTIHTKKVPLLDEKGEPEFLLGISEDITERKKMEETLRARDIQLKKLTSWVPGMMYQFTKRPDGTFYVPFSTEAIKDIFGCSAQDVLEDFSPIVGAILLEDLDKVVDSIEYSAANLTIWTCEYRVQIPGQSIRWILGKSTPEKLADGSITWYGFNTDITETKKVEEQLQESLESLRKAIGSTIQVMVSAVEARDPYTAGHQIRVANLARAIATEMGLPPDTIEGLRMAGSIHDIGKLSIPAEILSKPTKLTNLEFSLIKEHSLKGYEMLKDVESPWPLAQIVYQHHERMDGSGYPGNLKGDEIIMEARILAVADVVEAMASYRPYRPAIGVEAALNEIEKNKGTLYDADAVDACLRLFQEKGFQLEGAR
jgi:PAS domain S-box-containing protein/putative nucleotidyltransferase with HDIG domain